MPGGLDGVKNVTAQLKARGVNVLWPYNPWDTGTHREPLSDADTFAKLLKETGGDGFNGDTMGFVGEEFWNASVKAGYPLAFEPEGGGIDESLNWSTMGWGYWTYPTAPLIDRFKYITKGKFMTNICNRWAQAKTNDLQSSWFNGCGYESWENVWGTWNGITPRDGEAIRRVATMLRFFGGKTWDGVQSSADVDHLHSPDWEPHVPQTIQQGVFASKFPGSGASNNNNNNNNVYTVVNRGGKNTTGQQLWIPAPAPGTRVFDCYHGTELSLEDPAQPDPGPDPLTPPPAYNLYSGANAYTGHGATDIDSSPVAQQTVAQCTARCDADANCNCVTFMPYGTTTIGSDGAAAPALGACWKRSQCQPAGFATDGKYDVYLNAKRAGDKDSAGYSTWTGKNAYAGTGATSDIDSDSQAPTGQTEAQCRARCEADSKCSCVTFQKSTGKCWKRAGCDPRRFGASGAFEVFVAEARQPRCPSCFNPVTPPKGAKAVSFDVEVDGYGCVYEVAGAVPGVLAPFMAAMKGLTGGTGANGPLYAQDGTWKYLPQTIVDIPATPPAATAPHKDTWMHIPKTAAPWRFVSRGVMIEGDDNHGVDIQYPWEDHPAREHDHTFDSLGPFYMQKFPVTVDEYWAYLQKTGFRPKDPYNWLKNWNNGTQQPVAAPPASMAKLPVTYVSRSNIGSSRP